jgi:uncharacterized membrane protein
MAEATKTRRRRGHSEPAEKARSKTSEATEQADEAKEQVEEQAPEPEAAVPTPDGGGETLFSELRETIRDAALDVLRPVAREATTSMAKVAVAKGPDLVKDKVMPKVVEAGGAGALAKGALGKGGDLASGIGEKLGGKGGKSKKPSGHGRGRRLPVQEHVDVGVDAETAYNQWTQFEEFPQFMHRVEKIEQKDDTTLMWHENIWGVRRSWEAEILDQQPNERVAWRGKGQTEVVGVVTFHRLSDRLTRVMVNMDFQPKGLFEKTASGFRISRRAVKSDLMRFKAYIEMKDDPTGAWRGRIEEGEVVDEEERGREDEEPRGEAEDEEPRGEAEDEEPREEEAEEEEYEDEYEEEEEEPTAEAEEEEEEPTAEAEEEEEEPEEPEEEPEEEKAPRRRPRRRTTAGTRRR